MHECADPHDPETEAGHESQKESHSIAQGCEKGKELQAVSLFHAAVLGYSSRVEGYDCTQNEPNYDVSDGSIERSRVSISHS